MRIPRYVHVPWYVVSLACVLCIVARGHAGASVPSVIADGEVTAYGAVAYVLWWTAAIMEWIR